MEHGNELLALEQLTADQLSGFVNQLIDQDLQRLVQLLYRLDVSEEKLKKVLADHPAGNAGTMIAQLILERLEQSRITRQQFKSGIDIPEDEKW